MVGKELLQGSFLDFKLAMWGHFGVKNVLFSFFRQKDFGKHLLTLSLPRPTIVGPELITWSAFAQLQ